MADTTWPRAREIAGACTGVLASELLAIPPAVERTTAAPVVALGDLPGFDTAAMDGWAVSGSGPWQVRGTVLAGAAPGHLLHAGQAVVIATGAAVPEGADAVIRRETGAVEDGLLTAEGVDPGTDVRPCGEECVAGETILLAGRVVTPGRAGLIAAAGVDRIAVTRVPRVHVLLLGDELLDAGVPAIGQVRDSLGPQLPGWVARLGGAVTAVTAVADTVAALSAALSAASAADIIVTTGGTAAGPVDCLHASLAEVGARLLVDSVAVRPGHPMVLAKWGDVPIVGLPGNPQSAVVGLMTLGAPVLRAQLGRPEPALTAVELGASLGAPATEHRLVAGSLTGSRFTAAEHLGSAMLRGLADSTGFAVLPPGGAAAGTAAPWLPLP